jgi:hypothetical protein
MLCVFVAYCVEYYEALHQRLGAYETAVNMSTLCLYSANLISGTLLHDPTFSVQLNLLAVTIVLRVTACNVVGCGPYSDWYDCQLADDGMHADDVVDRRMQLTLLLD